MEIPPKIQRLIKISRAVIEDCALENGAIVSANTDKPYCPKEAADYRFVWPRDASFICVAAEYLKLPIQESFFRWVSERPEDFEDEKLLYSNYSTNGRLGSMGKQFMADQMGTLLWAIYFHFKKNLKKALKFKDLIERLANGLAKVWNKTYFLVNTTDLWEESHRQTSTRIQNNFTYTLAACARGLLCAHEIIPNPLWKDTAMQMLSEIEEAYNKKDKYFYRNVGKISDPNIDASLVGLVYPFKIHEPNSEKIFNTVEKIEKEVVINGGVHRYQFDYFDSEGSSEEGSGAWPVLNFWMSVYWSWAKNKGKALKYYNWVIDRSDRFKGYLPEQYFNDFRIGIYPLVWSHAMFIIASHYLGYL